MSAETNGAIDGLANNTAQTYLDLWKTKKDEVLSGGEIRFLRLDVRSTELRAILRVYKQGVDELDPNMMPLEEEANPKVNTEISEALFGALLDENLLEDQLKGLIKKGRGFYKAMRDVHRMALRKTQKLPLAFTASYQLWRQRKMDRHQAESAYIIVKAAAVSTGLYNDAQVAAERQKGNIPHEIIETLLRGSQLSEAQFEAKVKAGEIPTVEMLDESNEFANAVAAFREANGHLPSQQQRKLKDLGSTNATDPATNSRGLFNVQ